MQSNLVNSKTLGLEVLFRIISSLHSREVITTKSITIRFFVFKYKDWAREETSQGDTDAQPHLRLQWMPIYAMCYVQICF